MSDEQTNYSELEHLSVIAFENGDLNKIQEMLVSLMKVDDKTRTSSENLFVYRTLGKMYQEQGQFSQASEAYLHAYSYDVRDQQSLEYLVSEELKKSPEKVDTKLLMDLLIFHRESLKNNLVMKIFKTIGDAQLESGELNRARDYYEKALDVRPGDMDLIQALLKVSEASGDEQAILKSREKLLNTLTAPESRAAVLVSIGDDYLNNAKDEKRAMEAYEEALAECSESVAALQRILIIAERSEDWERALNALTELVKSVPEDDEKCKYMLKMAWIFKEKLNNSKRAIQLFNDILDIQPGQVEIFQGMINMLKEQNDLKGMEENYVRMMERQKAVSPVNTKLLAGVCKALGDLRLRQLNDIPGAAKAYKVISELYPDDVRYHAILAKLYALSDNTLEEAIHENREILRLSPDHLEAVGELAKCYRKLEKYDEALCIYRVLDVLNMNDDEGKAIVQRLASVDVPQINAKMSGEILDLIRPRTLDLDIVNLLREATMHIRSKFDNEISTYVHPKNDLINLNEPTVFSRILRNSSASLGFSAPPVTYKYSKYNGIMNPHFTDASLLIPTSLLAGRRNCEVSFAVTKALMLLTPEFYLLTLGQGAIEQIILTIFKIFRPNLNIPLSKEQQSLRDVIINRLGNDEAAFNRLKGIVNSLAKRGGNLNTLLFMESAEDYCNRMGLLFCDSPEVIEKMLSEEVTPISSRSVRDRIGSLLVWAMSEDYISLRKKLGINISLS